MFRGTSHRRKRRSDAIGYLIIGVVVCVIVAALIFLFIQSRQQSGIDAENGCPKSGPTAVTVIVLDMTDPLGPVQKPKVMNIVEEEKDSLPKGGRIDIYTIEPFKSEAPTPQFSGCNPGTANQVDNPFSENPKRVEKKWAYFTKRVELVLGNLVEEKGQKESPIIECVNAASTISFGPYQTKNINKRLVLISDLIEYGKAVSFYRQTPNFDDFKKTSFYQQNKPDLSGVDVRIGVLARNNVNEDKMKELVEFWITMIRDAGGDIEHYQWISG